MKTTPQNRRQFMMVAGAAVSAVAAPSLMAASAPARTSVVRKNIDLLTAGELAIYEHAVRLLMEDAKSKSGAVALHPALRQLESLTTVSPGTPWEREHLAGIESLLRATDPKVTASLVIPYWDFTKPPSGKSWPAAFERISSPLRVEANGSTRLDPALWSYHAYIDVVWQRWEHANGPLSPGMMASLFIGEGVAEIRVRKSVLAA